MTRARILLGIVLVWVTGIALFLGLASFAADGRADPISASISILHYGAPLILLMFPGAAIVFLPGALASVMLLRRWKATSLVAFAGAGALISIVTTAVLVLASRALRQDVTAIVGAGMVALFAGPPGALAGISYAMLARRLARRRAGA